jgi:hypothetical protein
MALNVYSWEYIHRYFPPEVIEQYRKQIINEWKSKQFKDKPSKPKNPSHKLGEDEVKIIIEKAREERERIRTRQFEFEYDMEKDDQYRQE